MNGYGRLAAVWCVLCLPAAAAPPDVLPGSARLEAPAGLAAAIVEQWDGYLLGEIEKAKTERARFWQRDTSSPEGYARSIKANRDRLQRAVGAIDRRVPAADLELVASLAQSSRRAETPSYSVLTVRWPVFPGVHGEGLLLKPRGEPRACVVAIPDADQLPEMLAGLNPGVAPESQMARRLAEHGIMVLLPTLLDRRTIWSADERLDVHTDQSHREWIYRQAGEVGRHPIGYEVQKVRAAIDWFLSAGGPAAGSRVKIGVAGYGEGGLLALYTAALDERVDAAWVSGYFQPREQLWQEPLYRNIWGLLTEFGDAELAAMIAPRGLVVEYSEPPAVSHPPPPDPAAKRIYRVAGAGRIATPPFALVSSEWERARKLAGPYGGNFELIAGADGRPVRFGSPDALRSFVRLVGGQERATSPEPFANAHPPAAAEIDARQRRQIRELQEFTQERLRLAEYEREKFFWSKLEPKSPATWDEAVRSFRNYFWDEVIGRFPDSGVPLNPRSRRLAAHSDAQMTTYEILLDVSPGVETWGYLLLPADLKAGEQRPVVVCQHGAGGQPVSTLEADGPYQEYAVKLARRGFIVYSPYNPNKLLGEKFRQLQRKGNPLKKTIFGIFAANHQRTLHWLKQLPFVDGRRIAFYGLSYGGKTAVRVPAVLEDYCLSICSGDFNDYVQKVTSVRSDKNSFMFVDSYENVQFNLGNTFNYAEMAALIAPRPFMVEHGYKDRVAPLEWAAAEYSKVRKLYSYLGVPERTAMAFFDGPHMIHGEETFAFLHRHLRWPAPEPDPPRSEKL
ncbi:MAG: dienelactone hydrolase family protein [Verrucomicrobia bacterium]|nr:dienelactone hydrolase family protein [Verrucomicrobiota bacterium]